MTYLKSLVLCLGLQFVSQVQASPQATETPRELQYSYGGFRPPRATGTPREFQYSYDGIPPPRATGTPRGRQYSYAGISPPRGTETPRELRYSYGGIPPPRGTGTPREFEYNYDGIPPPRATETPPELQYSYGGIPPPRGTGTPREFEYNYDGFPPPQATETGAGVNTSKRGPYASRPGETNAPYPLSSVTDDYGSLRVTTSVSNAVVFQTTGTSPGAVSSSLTRKSRASYGFSLDGATKTPVETVTLLPTPYIKPSGWVTKRSAKVSSVSSSKASTTKTKTAQPSSTPSANATCKSGKTYTVISNDTCQKIAIKEKVSTGQLISLIQPPSTCNNLQIGQKLCLPKPCKLYKVQSGDFCFKITTKFNIELADLYAANPEINSQCSNLVPDANICIPDAATA